MAAAAIDILSRLTDHMRAAELAKGGAVIKSDAFYDGLLETADRAAIEAHLKAHGFEMAMGRGGLGQLWLTVRKRG